MHSEALILWDKIIDQYGLASGLSRYAGCHLHMGDQRLNVGAEYQPASANYSWHGLRRGGTPKTRWISFQWTIEGEGVLQVGKKKYLQTPGQVLLAPVPSDHEYRVSSSGPGWKFFYIVSSTHWIVDRLAAAVSDMDYTFPLPLTSRLAIDTLQLIQQTYVGGLEDRFDAEKAALNWMVEIQRHLNQIRHPDDSREAILAQARKFYDEHRASSFGVEDFASSLGMSRVRASIHFQKLTGQSPAAYFMELRLKEAINLLGQGLKLQRVAEETGFADANHFCKVFRRVYHVSPGQFRKMIGVKPPRLS